MSTIKYKKIYDGDKQTLTIHKRHDPAEDEIPVEKRLSAFELERLHANIRFTQQFKADELKRNLEQ